MRTLVSIIIPVKKINDFLRQETIPALLEQSYSHLEIIILPDRSSQEKFPQTKIIPTWPKTGPADKRDLGAQKAKGEILGFLDDDSYPDKNWLKRALVAFKENKKAAGICGPSLTPFQDNLFQKASGWVWSTWLGSGGAGTYRCAPGLARQVDDFPTVNLLVRKKDFLAVGGFDSQFWPGEDTKLCHDLVYCLKKKIYYQPNVLVYHHRRPVFIPHLRQIARYALHRGHFVRILPKTSFRFGYFIPTIFALGLTLGIPFVWLLAFFNFADLGALFGLIWLGAIGFYLSLLFLTAVKVFIREKNLTLALLIIPAIFTTHLVYGVLFLKGLFSAKLESVYSC